MESELSIGFLGFGEAGSHIAKGLKSSGCSRITAFDIAPHLVRDRAADAGVPLVASNRELADSAGIIFSTVTCAQAKEAAEQTGPYLNRLEALMLEYVMASAPFGTDERVFASLMRELSRNRLAETRELYGRPRRRPR
jgi:3-hydroxyisobutyrate dehydrogenase-like beta-hydroxyacid dehydrogenase